jgi:hypothetical protein
MEKAPAKSANQFEQSVARLEQEQDPHYSGQPL